MRYLLFLLCVGCIPATPAQPKPTPKPVIVQPIADDTPDALTLSVNAESSLIATLHEIIGDGGSVTLDPSEPIVVTRPEATLTIKPGTRLTYSMTADSGRFTFSEPRPRVTAKVWGLKVSPELTRLDLNADNTGTAHVQSGPVKLQRRFALNWEQPTGASESAALPVVTIYTTDFCGYCNAARTGLADVDEFTLREVHTRSGSVPGWVTSFPTFHWQTSSGWKKYVGWPGRDSLVASWRLSIGNRYQGRAASQWTFPGSTRDELTAHLMSGQHAGKFDHQQLAAMTFDELMRLHADDHEGVVDWQAVRRQPLRVSRPPPANRAAVF